MRKVDMTFTQLIADSYKSYHHSVYLYINYKIGKDEDAKDLSQDVFLRLMDYKQMLRPDTIRNFIYSITRNLITDYLRRHYKIQEATSYIFNQSSTFTNDVENQIIANDLSLCERRRVASLPEQRRRIYVMNRFENKTTSEISIQLGLSPRTVENHLFISRKEIRDYIQQCI